MTRACTTAALALLLTAPVLTPARAQADETIRVAIFQNVESVTVVSSAGLIVQAPNDTVDSNGQITVGAGASGLIVDGQRLRSDRLDVRGRDGELTDRKSTRLNSSHGYISYAVFCLKKKKTQKKQ